MLQARQHQRQISFYNTDIFNDYSGPDAGDCMNFASQAIYAGFSGSNNLTSVNAGTAPQDTVGIAAGQPNAAQTKWYAKPASTYWAWTSCGYFRDYIDYSVTDTETRLRAVKKTITASSDFSEVGTANLIGSIIHVNGNKPLGIIGQIRVVKAGRSFGPALSQAVRHEEQLLEIRPVDPDGKQALAVIDAVGDQPVDLYHMMAEFRAEFCDEVDAVIRKLLEAGGRDELRHGEQPTALHAHCVVDPFIIALNSGSDDTEIADDPGIFIPLQLIVQLQLRRLMLIFKNAQRNADQIGNF